jgi:hypothetical protein
MNGQTQANIIITIIGILFIALCLFIINIRNTGIEAQCIAKGGQVLVTPGKISSCLYPVR